MVVNYTDPPGGVDVPEGVDEVLYHGRLSPAQRFGVQEEQYGERFVYREPVREDTSGQRVAENRYFVMVAGGLVLVALVGFTVDAVLGGG